MRWATLEVLTYLQDPDNGPYYIIPIQIAELYSLSHIALIIDAICLIYMTKL